jgi:hypothetical protein
MLEDDVVTLVGEPIHIVLLIEMGDNQREWCKRRDVFVQWHYEFTVSVGVVTKMGEYAIQ